MHDEKERNRVLSTLFFAYEKLADDKKAVGNEIDAARSQMKEVCHEAEDDSLIADTARKTFRKIEGLEGRRKEIGGKMKRIWSDFRDCLYGKGEFDKTQLTFPMNTDDPEQFVQDVKTTKLDPEPKNKK